MNPFDTLSKGYASAGADPGAQRQRRRLAESYRPNADNEALLRLAAEQPAVFASLPATARMAAGSYALAKQAYEDAQKEQSQ